jgi:hypothetical protein
MLQQRNSIKDIIINWVIMLVVMLPTATLGVLGYLYGMLWLLQTI